MGDRSPEAEQPGFGRSRRSESATSPSEPTDAPSSPWCRRAGQSTGAARSQIRCGANARQNPPRGRPAARRFTINATASADSGTATVAAPRILRNIGEADEQPRVPEIVLEMHPIIPAAAGPAQCDPSRCVAAIRGRRGIGLTHGRWLAAPVARVE